MALRKAAKTAEKIADQNTFATIANQWFEHWKDRKSSRHVNSTRRRLDTNILPSLGALQTAKIKAPDIVSMVRVIESCGAHDIAKRAMGTTEQIFRYAIAHGYAKRNPAADFHPSDVLRAARAVNYARVEAKELPHLLRRIEVYPGTQVTRLAIKLMALTFVRTSELIGARWDQFDLEAARWNIPAMRMKMRTPHIIPLSRQSLEVLEELRVLTGESERLFPGDRDAKKTMSNNTILKGLERMGYRGRKMTLTNSLIVKRVDGLIAHNFFGCFGLSQLKQVWQRQKQHPHVLKHSIASHLVSANVNLALVKQQQDKIHWLNDSLCHD